MDTIKTNKIEAEELAQKLTTQTGYSWRVRPVWYSKSSSQEKEGPTSIELYVVYIPGAR